MRRNSSSFYSIHFTNFLEINNKTHPKTIAAAPITVNTSEYPSEVVKLASCPPKMLAIPELASHTPINKEASFTGASELTIDSPTGDKNSSPNVWKRYVKTINSKFAFSVMLCSSLPVLM